VRWCALFFSCVTGAAAPAMLHEPPATLHEHPPPLVLAPGYADLEYVPPAPGTYRLPPLGVAGDGTVVDSSGVVQRLHDLIGDKVTVLSFIFTRCSDVNGCPLATFVMRAVQDRVAADSELRGKVRLLSLSFDPEYDSPAVLESHAAHFRKRGFDWRFLTTVDEATLKPILAAYDQSVVPDVDESGARIGTISHILRVYLIDRQRRIRNIYSTSFLHADTVANDVRTLLREPADAAG
jgi:cytochrome oxidase Cu insertion factor (SCO1/SenC/PrrC family)